MYNLETFKSKYTADYIFRIMLFMCVFIVFIVFIFKSRRY